MRFVCRKLKGHLTEVIEEHGYSVTSLAAPVAECQSESSDYRSWLGVSWQDDAKDTRRAIDDFDKKPDWLIVDHYGLDSRWEETLGRVVGRIAAIDDLANRRHTCDLLLDQNHYENSNTRYFGKVPEHCQLLLGPRYALLQRDFRVARNAITARSGPIRGILVFFGGHDVRNYTMVAIDALNSIGLRGVKVDVVIGAQNPNREEIVAACDLRGFICHVQTHRMPGLMSEAGLAIGAGGSTTWERCCLGLPCLTFALAENQRGLVHDAALAGLLFAPDIDPSDGEALAKHLQVFVESPLLLEAMSRRSMKAVDGRGTDRVLRAMGVFSISIREADNADSKQIFMWRNDPAIRQVSRNKAQLEWPAHKAWFDSIQRDSTKLLLIGESGGQPIGVVRFDVAKAIAELSIYMVPGQSGLGLGTELLLTAERWLAMTRPEVQMLSAEVLEDNLPSHRLFSGAGYRVNTTGYSKRLQ